MQLPLSRVTWSYTSAGSTARICVQQLQRPAPRRCLLCNDHVYLTTDHVLRSLARNGVIVDGQYPNLFLAHDTSVIRVLLRSTRGKDLASARRWRTVHPPNPATRLRVRVGTPRT